MMRIGMGVVTGQVTDRNASFSHLVSYMADEMRENDGILAL